MNLLKCNQRTGNESLSNGMVMTQQPSHMNVLKWISKLYEKSLGENEEYASLYFAECRTDVMVLTATFKNGSYRIVKGVQDKVSEDNTGTATLKSFFQEVHRLFRK